MVRIQDFESCHGCSSHPRTKQHNYYICPHNYYIYPHNYYIYPHNYYIYQTTQMSEWLRRTPQERLAQAAWVQIPFCV